MANKTAAQHYASGLEGKTVKRVRSVTSEEMANLGWYPSSDPTCVIEFTDGTWALVEADPEGNGTGFLTIGG